MMKKLKKNRNLSIWYEKMEVEMYMWKNTGIEDQKEYEEWKHLYQYREQFSTM